MKIEKQENQFTVESNGKTYVIPFISNVILEGDKTYYSTEITWDTEVSPTTLKLIEELSAPKLEKKK